MENNKEKLDQAINSFLGEETPQPEVECNTEECRIKKDRSILERINKKIITEDGRQLLY